MDSDDSSVLTDVRAQESEVLLRTARASQLRRRPAIRSANRESGPALRPGPPGAIPDEVVPHDSATTHHAYELRCGSGIQRPTPSFEPPRPYPLPVAPPSLKRKHSDTFLPQSSTRATSSNGCGALIDLAAQPNLSLRAWTSLNPRNISQLNSSYVKLLGPEEPARNLGPQSCGCTRHLLGCTNCGNILGTVTRFCVDHTSSTNTVRDFPVQECAYIFMASRVTSFPEHPISQPRSGMRSLHDERIERRRRMMYAGEPPDDSLDVPRFDPRWTTEARQRLRVLVTQHQAEDGEVGSIGHWIPPQSTDASREDRVPIPRPRSDSVSSFSSSSSSEAEMGVGPAIPRPPRPSQVAPTFPVLSSSTNTGDFSWISTPNLGRTSSPPLSRLYDSESRPSQAEVLNHLSPLRRRHIAGFVHLVDSRDSTGNTRWPRDDDSALTPRPRAPPSYIFDRDGIPTPVTSSSARGTTSSGSMRSIRGLGPLPRWPMTPRSPRRRPLSAPDPSALTGSTFDILGEGSADDRPASMFALPPFDTDFQIEVSSAVGSGGPDDADEAAAIAQLLDHGDIGVAGTSTHNDWSIPEETIDDPDIGEGHVVFGEIRRRASLSLTSRSSSSSLAGPTPAPEFCEPELA
ncbi:hypothetical protein DL93DRAFT_2071276 [Clavulina sp. PMI_390]|nr:hypothetical protein DL93DRAFT_2071276 [Clavulina sp. PMI_390]